MAEDLEQSQDRLDNIQAIDPILSALRTISMGSWQSALNRLTNVKDYRLQFADLYDAILPFIHVKPAMSENPKRKTLKTLTIVVGSERGLVGKFNRDMLGFATSFFKEQQENHINIDLWLLGSRLERIAKQQHIPYISFSPLSTTSLPPYQLAADLTKKFLLMYEKHTIDAVDVIYNSYQGASRYKIKVERIIPFSADLKPGKKHKTRWPPLIVETNPISLYTQLVKQETTIHFFELLLSSAAAEHSARFQLLEEASQNSERLIEELNLAIQMSRRQEITREMQELAVGAGMLAK